jgi:hypothetical protein
VLVGRDLGHMTLERLDQGLAIFRSAQPQSLESNESFCQSQGVGMSRQKYENLYYILPTYFRRTFWLRLFTVSSPRLFLPHNLGHFPQGSILKYSFLINLDHIDLYY